MPGGSWFTHCGGYYINRTSPSSHLQNIAVSLLFNLAVHRLLLFAGSLATAGYGTALGVIRALAEKGILEACFCTETRPYNQVRRVLRIRCLHGKCGACTVIAVRTGCIINVYRECCSCMVNSVRVRWGVRWIPQFVRVLFFFEGFADDVFGAVSTRDRVAYGFERRLFDGSVLVL